MLAIVRPSSLIVPLRPGIPKFFRWLVTKYPDINQPCADKDIPNVDNLYLDMNGIVYVNLAPSEEETMMKIFEYLDVLVQKARPKKVIFIAIDGESTRSKSSVHVKTSI